MTEKPTLDLSGYQPYKKMGQSYQLKDIAEFDINWPKMTTTNNWDLVVFNGLTLKGIYGREMYETWYKMTSMIQSGLDIRPVIGSLHLRHPGSAQRT